MKMAKVAAVVGYVVLSTIAAVSRASVISLDINTIGEPVPSGDLPVSFPTGISGGWQGMWIGPSNPPFSANHPPQTSLQLGTRDGSPTKYAVTFMLGWDTSFNVATYGTHPIPELQKDYAFIRESGQGGYGPQSHLDLTFGSLIAGNTYDVNVFTAGAPAVFTIDGSGPITVSADGVGTFVGLVADVNREIHGVMTYAGTDNASIAGVEIRGNFFSEDAVVPEPGTLALLWAAAAVVLLERKRTWARCKQSL
jgi:hypothetical protein